MTNLHTSAENDAHHDVSGGTSAPSDPIAGREGARGWRAHLLDWDELVDRLADEAHSPGGRAACAALAAGEGLAEDAESARERLVEVDEAVSLLGACSMLPSLAFDDVEPQIAAAERGSVLGPAELGPVATVCEIAAEARRFFTAEPDDAAANAPRRRPASPRLALRARPLEPLGALVRRVRSTFDAAGEVRDEVSPELARLRREREAMSGRVRAQIEDVMRDEAYAPLLQDRFWTIRGDRYVLPLRASAKSMGLGILHDTSRTGETVFVEPTSVVALNNRLKLAELEIEREIRRILEELSAEVALAAPLLRANLAVLIELDVIAAKARLAAAYGGTRPELVDQNGSDDAAAGGEGANGTILDLRQAAHPILMLRQSHGRAGAVVRNDITLGGERRVLVISGPNAGGKTVLLKTAGLAALMVRAGMLLPAAPQSRIGFFHGVFAEIGDQQSVVGDLSTFSAHLANVAAILRQTEALGPGKRSLVLLDELMAGTNPDQGAALARATLEAFAGVASPSTRIERLVLVTTHYDALKSLADEDARFANAGMDYDVERLTPTFRMRAGLPGRSFAFDIAARMGLPEAVMTRARTLATRDGISLEDTVAALEAERQALEAERERLEAARVELEEASAAQRAAEESFDRRRRELNANARAVVEETAREAREQIRAIVRDAQAAGTMRAAEAARAELATATRDALERLPAPAPPQANAEMLAPIAIGQRVRVPALGANGVVVTGADERGRVKVSAGALTVEVAVADLKPPTAGADARSSRHDRRRAAAEARGGGRPSPPPPVAVAADSESLPWAMPTAVNTLDLRGRRADDVLDEVVAYLDRAALDGRSPVFIIHGHGTGALKKIVRSHLATSPYVHRFAPGGRGQGGDGVTVVELKS